MKNKSNIKPEDIITSDTNNNIEVREELFKQMSDLEQRVNSIERLIMQVLDKIESGSPIF
jgi:regulator of RNase E activity RraA